MLLLLFGPFAWLVFAFAVPAPLILALIGFMVSPFVIASFLR